jgi:hypothetical protein
MRSLPILDEIPPGYFIEEAPRGILALAIDVARDFHEARFGPQSDGELVPSDLAGRKPLQELEVGGRRYVVRRFSHGGILRWMTGERFLDPERPFRELILAASLASWGLRTPAIVAARARYARAGGWILEVVSRRVEGTIDMGKVLRMTERGELGFAERRRLFAATGRFLRELHRHGLSHADLTPNNILVQRAALEGAPPELWIIDLEGSQLRDTLDFKHCRSNLRRLYRHVARMVSEGTARVERTDLLRFLRAYEPNPSRWKAYWRIIRREHRRSRGFHSGGWFLERRFAERPR